MYAEDRAGGTLSPDDLSEICKQINAPEWFISAVENQKIRILNAKCNRKK